MKNNNKHQLSNHAMGVIDLLIVQYILGMFVNLYVGFPDTKSIAAHWEFVRGQGLVMAHIVVGTFIVAGAIALYVRALRQKNRTWKIAGGVAMGAAILAWVCGEEFVSSQVEMYSFAMSLFFLVALVSLGWGVYKSRK